MGSSLSEMNLNRRKILIAVSFLNNMILVKLNLSSCLTMSAGTCPEAEASKLKPIVLDSLQVLPCKATLLGHTLSRYRVL